MHFPSVGERVWVSGCKHECVVVQADYAARLAMIAPVELLSQQKLSPFFALFAHDDFEASQVGTPAMIATRQPLDSSRACISDSRTAIHDLRQAIELSQVLIKKSEQLITESDVLIKRWEKMLGAKPDSSF